MPEGRLTPNRGHNGIPLLGMTNQTSEAFAYVVAANSADRCYIFQFFVQYGGTR